MYRGSFRNPQTGCVDKRNPTCLTQSVEVQASGEKIFATAEAYAWDDFAEWKPTAVLNVLSKEADGWAVRQQVLPPVDIQQKPEMQFGASLAVYGNHLVVGAPALGRGRLSIFEFNCSADAFESVLATPTTTRQCSKMRVCGSGTAFQSVAPTRSSDRVCQPLVLCQAGQYQSVPPTPTTDRGCDSITTCLRTQYQLAGPTLIADRACRNISVCDTADGRARMTDAETDTTDRLCECNAGYFGTGYACTPWTECDAGTHWEYAAGQHDHDYVCEPLKVCSVHEYQILASTR